MQDTTRIWSGLYGRKPILVLVIGLIIVLILSFILILPSISSNQSTPRPVPNSNSTDTQAFLSTGLGTDTSKKNIELSQVISGCYGRDCIPAIYDPKFTQVDSVNSAVSDSVQGLLVTVGSTTRFYSYNILVWHEIVNDTIEGKPLAITFCPLCGSGIVFDALVDGQSRTFGVSGKLYESNLLMYDHTNQSLWSQTLGEAVVGEDTGKKLERYPAQLIAFEEVKKNYPDAEILSTDTGHARDYSFYPYGDYETDQSYFLFNTSFEDKRFDTKEIMYAFHYQDTPIAMRWSELRKAGGVKVAVGADVISVVFKDGEVTASAPDGEVLPGYFEMWFSWSIHWGEVGVVWPTS